MPRHRGPRSILRPTAHRPLSLTSPSAPWGRLQNPCRNLRSRRTSSPPSLRSSRGSPIVSLSGLYPCTALRLLSRMSCQTYQTTTLQRWRLERCQCTAHAGGPQENRNRCGLSDARTLARATMRLVGSPRYSLRTRPRPRRNHRGKPPHQWKSHLRDRPMDHPWSGRCQSCQAQRCGGLLLLRLPTWRLRRSSHCTMRFKKLRSSAFLRCPWKRVGVLCAFEQLGFRILSFVHIEYCVT
jgi:hypothetical protein